jgi:hypothetical protein
VAEAIGATWSADDFDAHQADMRAVSATARRSGAGEVGWSTMGARAYELTLTVGAPTAARAEAAARERVPPLPEGWQVHVRVDFAGD